MIFKNVSILGLAHMEANQIVRSQDMEEKLAHNLERFGSKKNPIQSLTGILERRFWNAGVQPSDAATQAAERVLGMAQLNRAKIGLLLSTSVCKDFVEPSVACLVHGNLGLSSACVNYDIGNACNAFLNGMEVAAVMIESGQLDYAMVVDGEECRKLVEETLVKIAAPTCDEKTFKENFATLTLGCGAAAMILCKRELAPDGHIFLGGVTLADTKNNRLCCWRDGQMITDASKLLSEGVKLAIKTYAKAKEDLGWKDKKLDAYVFHQVGMSHVAKVSEALQLDLLHSYVTFPFFGNMGPASVPFTLSKGYQDGQFHKGQRIALMGIGSGLNCSMMELIW